MSALNPEFSISSVNYKTGESVQGTVELGKSITYATTLSATTSTDPFASKTNKFAESAMIRIICSAETKIKAGGSGISAADANDYMLAANVEYFFQVSSNNNYFRVFAAATPTVYVTEVR